MLRRPRNTTTPRVQPGSCKTNNGRCGTQPVEMILSEELMLAQPVGAQHKDGHRHSPQRQLQAALVEHVEHAAAGGMHRNLLGGPEDASEEGMWNGEGY